MNIRFAIQLLVVLHLHCGVASSNEDAHLTITIVQGGRPVIPLWPEGEMPGQPAKMTESYSPSGTKPFKAAEGSELRIRNVGMPDLLVFIAPSKAPTPAVIVCPGGGYEHLTYMREGTEVASWLNGLGVTALVLKYRVPSRTNALMDIQRALRLTRANANVWKIASERVGVIGFSAGGHLCARASTTANTTMYEVVDHLDALSGKPDFAILVYPAYLKKGTAVAPECMPSASTPPIFIAHSTDDSAYAPGSQLFASALVTAGIPCEYRQYATGGHGYGLHCKREASDWPRHCAEWLRSRKIIGQ